MMSFIGIGTNLGDRLENLRKALHALEKKIGPIACCSDVYETEAREITDQPAFLNMAVRVETDKNPHHMLECCLGIEKEMGRQPTIRFGPRIIDLDLLLMGSWVHSDNRLILPHPRMHLRRFVLVPLQDIASEVIHPVLNQSIQSILRNLSDSSKVDWYCKRPCPDSIITWNPICQDI